MKSAGELILYKDFNGTDEEIFYPMASIIERSRRGGMDAKEERQKFYECFHRLLEISASHGFQGNLWHNYLTYLLISNENAYSRACEIRGNIEGSINEIALHDFEVFRYFFEFDLEELGRKLGVDCIPVLLHYERFEGNGKVFNSRIRDRICDLSVRLEQTENVSEFKDCVTEFYRDFGVGKLGLHKAFRVEHHENGAGIVPITNIAHVHLDDLVGYELAKKKLVENTEAFVEGRAANNCLLFGDAGTAETTPPSEDTNTPENKPEADKELTFAEQVVELVNQERTKAGLSAVTLDQNIASAALVRAKEIETSFSHTRPNGSKFSTALTEQGVTFKGAGENIAWGQKSPEAVIQAWMNSEGHRANILNKNFTKIGVGYYQNAAGRNFWTQLFTY